MQATLLQLNSDVTIFKRACNLNCSCMVRVAGCHYSMHSIADLIASQCMVKKRACKQGVSEALRFSVFTPLVTSQSKTSGQLKASQLLFGVELTTYIVIAIQPCIDSLNPCNLSFILVVVSYLMNLHHASSILILRMSLAD